MTPTVAALVKSHVNDEFARCILALYRSAAQPAIATVGKLFTTAAPPNGLAIIAPNDHFVATIEDMHHVAKTVNATTATINDAGHWWTCSHPEQAASTLIEQWDPTTNCFQFCSKRLGATQTITSKEEFTKRPLLVISQ